MGNNCAGAREKATVYRSKSLDYYSTARKNAGRAVSRAKIKYGSQIAQARVIYDSAKLKANGFTAPNPIDNSPTQMITKFESSLPLGKISLLEYERRLKKLIDPSANDCISKK